MQTYRRQSRLQARLVVLATLLLLALPPITVLAKDSPLAPRDAAVARCRQDLSKRLQAPISQVTLVTAEAVDFPDASLGLPRPGEVYAQMITPGFRIILQAQGRRYLYAVPRSGNGLRYGGPTSARGQYALYLEPAPSDPNLNGTLWGVTLTGTNPRVLMEGVSAFHPQPSGAILAVRRTSRSGHDLFLVPSGENPKPVLLSRAFAFGSPVLSPDARRWAALVRPGVGATWELVMGTVDGQGRKVGPALPSDKLRRLYWTESHLVATAEAAGEAFELAEDGWRKLARFVPPDAHPVQFNKSESLQVKQDGESVVVSRVWFNGDAKVLATIRQARLHASAVTPDLGFVLITLRDGDRFRAVTVDLHTGEALDTLQQANSAVRLLGAAWR